jgi:hypothetical protein
MIPFGVSSVVETGKDTNDTTGFLNSFQEVLDNLYVSKMKINERLSCGERAIVGSISREARSHRCHFAIAAPWWTSHFEKARQQIRELRLALR